jgi:hypothetical protein
LARILILVVVAWNLQAAFSFLGWPGVFSPGFELSGAAGDAAVRGIAVLFLMWNVPYLAAAWHPVKNIVSLREALAMQFIGLLGETSIYLSLSAQHSSLRASILRFVLFDAAGLAALLLAFWMVKNKRVRPV